MLIVVRRDESEFDASPESHPWDYYEGQNNQHMDLETEALHLQRSDTMRHVDLVHYVT